MYSKLKVLVLTGKSSAEYHASGERLPLQDQLSDW
jgi:hypothetical protein